MSELLKLIAPNRRVLNVAVLNIVIALIVGVIFWLFQIETGEKTLYDNIAGSLIHASIYGMMFGLMVPYLSDRFSFFNVPWNWLFTVISFLAIAFFSTLLIELALVVVGYLDINGFRREYFFKSFGVFLLALAIGLCVYCYEQFKEHVTEMKLRLRERELENEQARKLIAEAKLAALESRLHPHFLFNTLNSISALIGEDPQLADEMVQRLASLLRTLLYASEQQTFTLESEIRLINDYLEIERTRFGERLKYSIDIEPRLLPMAIPPLSLQPIVENSIKHAVSTRAGGAEIRVTATQENSKVVIRVFDDGGGFTEKDIVTGHGLANLRSRLSTLFGEAAILSVDSDGTGSCVKISLPKNGLG